MNSRNLIADRYERSARLYPSLLMLSPALVVYFSMFPGMWRDLRGVWVTGAACGGVFLLAQLARDLGKRKEERLFSSWGGMPSIAVLRHRDNRIDRQTKLRYHRLLARLVKGSDAPTPASEALASERADQTYAVWSNYLRVHSRGAKSAELVHDENVSYGYRRNVYGLRGMGVTLCVVSAVVAGVRLCFQLRTVANLDGGLLASLVYSSILLILWLFRFTSDWVRVPADAYALRLAESVESHVGVKVGRKRK